MIFFKTQLFFNARHAFLLLLLLQDDIATRNGSQSSLRLCFVLCSSLPARKELPHALLPRACAAIASPDQVSPASNYSLGLVELQAAFRFLFVCFFFYTSYRTYNVYFLLSAFYQSRTVHALQHSVCASTCLPCGRCRIILRSKN